MKLNLLELSSQFINFKTSRSNPQYPMPDQQNTIVREQAQFSCSRWRCFFVLVAGLLATGNCVSPAAAQRPSRDAIYEQLAVESAALERQHSLLKQLIKAVGPSVAHIEAKKRQKPNATASGTSATRAPVVVEEAGSGIVIQRNGQFYVITNFHVIEDSNLSDIRIEAGGHLYSPTRLMHDRETDLSVMALSNSVLIPARLGDSSRVEIGRFCCRRRQSVWVKPFGELRNR